jgi:hypothetical protein
VSETDEMRRAMLALSKAGATCWRNNVGTGWVGEVHRLKNGDVLIKNPRPLHAGLCDGSSDLIAIVPVTVRPEHVGTTFGVFGAIEMKFGKGRLTDGQGNFLRHVSGRGGIAGVAYSAAEAVALINKYGV